jgi:hypothetical protein
VDQPYAALLVSFVVRVPALPIYRQSRTSATNCARIYNHTLARSNVFPSDWAFGSVLTTEHVWDSFVLASLLEDCRCRQQTLVVPHDGLQKDRFTSSIRARNQRFRLYSQPELCHHCRKCVRHYTQDGAEKKVSVVVIDGVTVGHPCCGIHNCHNPLAKNRHRFCPQHAPVHNLVCSVVGCDRRVQANKLTCDITEHQEVERIHHERGQACFQLKDRLLRAKVAHPNDAIAEDQPLPTLVDAENDEEDFNIQQQPGSSVTKKIRAQFGRRRTHNEQIIVAPCGMILARETFFGAEGVASVIVRLNDTYNR